LAGEDEDMDARGAAAKAALALDAAVPCRVVPPKCRLSFDLMAAA
jgi:hypothetical protein